MIRPVALRPDTLAHHAARVEVPRYDRSALRPSVVHLSVGAFHRSHQAVYLDELAQRGVTLDWGLVGVGLRRPQLLEVLSAQRGLYTVVFRSAEHDHARVVGAMRRYLLAPQRGDAVLEALASEHTRLVTLTITAAGYKVDAVTGAFDAHEPQVLADLAAPSAPGSALGYLVEALDRRRRAGRAPFTVLSCDNVPDNGALTRTALVAFARLRDPKLARWIEERVAFPSSMVDRITPQTTTEDRDWVQRRFGVADRWPVLTEPFSQWVIEDDFCNGRPPLDEVGAQFVSDVRPYALTKTRLLNASHCALGHLGTLAGLRRTDEAMADPVFGAYVAGLMQEEIAPGLPEVPGLDLEDYVETLLERLANPQMHDQLTRLCRLGSAKMPRHVLTSLTDALDDDRPHALLTLAVAGWMRFLRGTDELGRTVRVEDPLADRLMRLAHAGGSDPRPLLGERTIFGDLGDRPAFVASLGRALRALDRDGARAAIGACLPQSDHVAA